MNKGEFEIIERNAEGDRLTVEVEVAAPVVKKAFKRVYKSLLNYVSVPGFRSGKAPMDVIANKIGVDRFNEEVVAELLPKYYYQAVEGEERRPVSDVEYVEQNLVKGSPFKFKAAVDIAPEIELGDYNTLEVEEVALEEISDEDINKQLDGLKRRFAKMSDPEKGSKIENGHMIHLKYSGKIDGKEYKSLTNVTALIVGEDDMFPGFSENLIGMDKGEEKVFTVKMKDDFEAKYLAGKEIEFTAKVFAFQNAELPEIDDELAAKVGPFKTVDELKGKIREELEKQKTKEREDKYHQGLRKKLSEVVTVELSQERIDAAVDMRLEEIEARLKSNNATLDEHLTETVQSMEDFRKEIADAEMFDMKVDYALDKIAIAEKLEVSDKEVDYRIAMTAHHYKKDVADIRHALDSTGSVILRKFDIYREKAFTMLQERYRMKAGLETEEKNKD